jgi:hypothetical protein
MKILGYSNLGDNLSCSICSSLLSTSGGRRGSTSVLLRG